MKNPDVEIQNEGSIMLFRLLTDAAMEWAKEYIPEDAQWLGNGFACEWRYAIDIANGMTANGLVVI